MTHSISTAWISFWAESKQRRACRRRVAQLDRLLSVSRHVRVSWSQERSYILTTGRTDWVDPHPVTVRPAGSCIQPPPPTPRG
jgi:hypothetical protein